MATFTNQAVLTYNNTQALSNVTTGQIIDSLAVLKTSSQTEYSQAEKITYVVTVQNAGSAPYQGLTLTDDLGAFTEGTLTVVPLTYVSGSLLYFVNGVQQPAPAVTGTAELTVSGINVPAGGTAMLIYEAQVNNSAPLAEGSTITNTAAVSGDELTQPVTSSYTVTVSTEPYLTIEKTLSPVTVTGNGRITYTFVISNYGNTAADASANAVITDTLNPVLTDLQVTYNGAAWSEGVQYTYSAVTGIFESEPGAITVPAATYTADPVTGAVTTVPGTSTLVIEGNI